MPWKIRGGYNAEIYEDDGGEHRAICRLWGQGTARGRRDARMMYAAPEMYRLLRRALPRVDAGSRRLRAEMERIIESIDEEDKA